MLEEERAPLWQAFVDSGLVCNLQVTPPNYDTLLTLAQRYPSVRFLCNHLGLPSSLDPADATYGGLDRAAALDNVFVKASAFYAAADTSWDPRCSRALGYFTSLVSALGAERILEILKSLQRVTGDPRYRPSLWLQRRVQLGMS